MRIKLFIAVFLCLINLAVAQEFPLDTGENINDFANIFTSEEKEYLRSLLFAVGVDTAEISVVSVDTCLPLSPFEYAMDLFENWELGQAETDNGLLILFCKTETKIYTLTGYGLEGILPDSLLGRLLDEYYVPQRDSGKVTTGIIAFTEQVINIINENAEEIAAQNKEAKEGFVQQEKVSFWIGNTMWFFVGLFCLLFLFQLIYSIIQTIRAKKEATVINKGIKKDTVFNLLTAIGALGVLGASIYFFNFSFLSLFLVMFGTTFLIIIATALRGYRCEKDGLKMRFVKKEKDCNLYQCGRGHKALVKIPPPSSRRFGRSSGGFGGGSRGGSSHGGGSSGGGGAGR